MASFGEKLKHAWDIFTKDDDGRIQPYNYGGAVSYARPDRLRLNISSERSIISSIYTRMAIDAAAIDIQHVRLDDSGRYLSTISSSLNDCLTIEANIDQAARAFKQDVFMSLFEEGTIALVPIETSVDPTQTDSFDIRSLRVGRIVSWFPNHVRVSVYNEKKGMREEITVKKKFAAVVENPLYQVMNEPNSNLKRLTRKLSMLDSIDEQSSSGKLDLIIQLPYPLKTDTKREQAETRRRALEEQMKGSKYGIGYIDATERVTQLNRPAENNLLKQIEILQADLYSQLGLSEEVFKGTADEAAMLNYYNRAIEPIIASVSEAMIRTFLTKTARSQGHSIRFFRDPFKLVPIKDIAEIADKFTRNEILTANELRSALGYKPSSDPKADMLINSNMPAGSGVVPPSESIELERSPLQNES